MGRLSGGALLACMLCCESGCGGGGGGGGVPSTPGVIPAAPLPPAPPVPAFHDVTAGSGIDYAVGFTRPASGSPLGIAESNVGGAAAGDCDNDGDVDLFVTYGDTGPNRLYLNQLAEQGNGLRFIDTAAGAGVANTRPDGVTNDRHSGPTFVDLDGDADLDLVLGSLFSDPIRIYRNNGDCRFTDVTANSPELVAIVAPNSISAAFGDYDLDGDLDLFLTHWGVNDDSYAGIYSEHLWENVTDAAGIRFVNASVATNVAEILFATRDYRDSEGRVQTRDYTFTPAFARMDSDVWPDITVAGDFGTSQILVNRGNGTFRNMTEANLRDAQYGMGSALGDYDNDGDLDWFVTSIFGDTDATSPIGNRLYNNDSAIPGTVKLRDVTEMAGVAAGGWGWGACFIDLDNDRDLDLYHTNGWKWTFRGSSYAADASVAFVSTGFRFRERAVLLGLADTDSGRGVVCADFDEDGDIDLLQLTNKLPNSGVLWENRTAASANNYLRVKLAGLAPNTEAVGARIYVTLGSVVQMREVMIGGNYTAQHPTVQVFGLGSASVVDQVRVVWPARMPGPTQPAESIETAVAANQTLHIEQN